MASCTLGRGSSGLGGSSDGAHPHPLSPLRGSLPPDGPRRPASLPKRSGLVRVAWGHGTLYKAHPPHLRRGRACFLGHPCSLRANSGSACRPWWSPVNRAAHSGAEPGTCGAMATVVGSAEGRAGCGLGRWGCWPGVVGMGGWPGEAVEESGLSMAALGCQGSWSPSPWAEGQGDTFASARERISQHDSLLSKERSLREVLRNCSPESAQQEFLLLTREFK